MTEPRKIAILGTGAMGSVYAVSYTHLTLPTSG